MCRYNHYKHTRCACTTIKVMVRCAKSYRNGHPCSYSLYPPHLSEPAAKTPRAASQKLQATASSPEEAKQNEGDAIGGVKDEKIGDGKDTGANEDAAKEEGDAENPKLEKKYKYYETTNYKGIEIVDEDTMCAFCGEEFAERMLAIQLGNDEMWDDPGLRYSLEE